MFVFFRTDKVIEDLDLLTFTKKFHEKFPVFVNHVVIAWYLRNAKSVGLGPLMPSHMITLIDDFAQNIEIIKRWETAEEYFHRPELAVHGIVSGIKLESGEVYQISHITSSDYRYV